jgi:hypothetical protein
MTLSGSGQCKTSATGTARHVTFSGTDAEFRRVCNPEKRVSWRGTLVGKFDDGSTALSATGYRITSVALPISTKGEATIGLDSGQAGLGSLEITYYNIFFASGDLCGQQGETGPRSVSFDGSFSPGQLVDPPAWRADSELPTDVEWAWRDCVKDERVTQVSNADGLPVGQGAQAYRIALSDNDRIFGERCELSQANPPKPGFPTFNVGDERWISWQVLLPSSFHRNESLFNVIAQWKQLGGFGTPALAMAVNNGQFSLDSSDTNEDGNGTVIPHRVGTAMPNRWVKFTLHVKFSPDPSVGFIELYGNLDGSGQRQLLPLTHIWTMKYDHDHVALPAHARIGIYRKEEITGDTYVFYDGYTVATAKQASEANAFGLSGP